MPTTMAPGLRLARLVWLCSNSSAKDSVIGLITRLNTRVAQGSAAASHQFVRRLDAGGVSRTCAVRGRIRWAISEPDDGRSDRSDQTRNDQIDHSLDPEAGRIDRNGIGCGTQGSDGSFGVFRVAQPDIVQQTP